MYAQKIEGESWRGEKIEKGKIDKMSGSIFKSWFSLISSITLRIQISNSANFTN